MFRRKTLLVVGAGASCEAKLPSGHALKRIIADMLNIELSPGQPTTGDPLVRDYLVQHASAWPDSNAFTRLLTGARAIRNAMPLALSIDNFLDAHQGDVAIEVCGKLAIVKAVLDAESQSLLFDPDPNAAFAMEGLTETWYVRLAQLITENVRRSEVDRAAANLSIVTFNYDRCIEHFLRQAFITYYQLPTAEAEALVSRIPIAHPYGQVGRLDWQDPISGVGFGRPEAADLLKLSKEIRTFTERVEDEMALATIHDLVERAETIVYLGFAYHRQNLILLAPADKPNRNRKRLFGTALAISSSDLGVISTEIGNMFPAKTNDQIYDRSNLEASSVNCHDFLSAYGRTLTD